MDVGCLREVVALARPLRDPAGERSQQEGAALLLRLQSEVGLDLFRFAGDRWEPTRAGTLFLSRAEALLARLDATSVADLGALTGSLPGPEAVPAAVDHGCLTVGVLFPAAAELTALVVAAFRHRWPAVRVREVDIAAVGGEQAVVTGAADLAFVWAPVADEGLLVTPLFDDTMSAVLPVGHRLAAHSSLSVRELAEERYTVTRSMSPQWRVASTVPQWQQRPDLATEVDTVVEAVDAIAHGSAVSVGPMSLQRFSPVTGLRCVPVTDLARPTALLAQRRGDRRREVLDFTDVATSVSERNLSLVPGAVRPGAGTVGPTLRLTGRERDVLALVAAGLTAEAIGRRRGISAGTVRKHLQNVYAKLGVGDRLVAVDIARRHGLLPDGAAASGGQPGARAGRGAR